MTNNKGISANLRRMMILAGISVCLYAINRLLIIPLFPEVGFFRKYFGDVLALPVYLPLSYYLAWRLGLIMDDFQIKITHILGAVIIFSLLFEGLLPFIDATSTRDPIDILAYFAGGLVLYIVVNTGKRHSNNQ